MTQAEKPLDRLIRLIKFSTEPPEKLTALKLEALVGRAIENGWDILQRYEANKFDVQQDVFQDNYIIAFLANNKPTGQEILRQTFHYTQIIFNHHFAKALFGEEPRRTYIEYDTTAMPPKPKLGKDGEGLTFQNFAYYIALAVVSDNPIDYMYQAVFGE